MSKFSNRYLVDLRDSQNNSPSFKWKSLSIGKNGSVFLKYYGGDKLDNCTYNARGLLLSSPKPFVIIKEGDSHISYEYDGDVFVNRITEGRNRIDIITNLDEIINDIQEFINQENAPE